MPSHLSVAVQNDPQKYCNADLKLSGSGHMQDDCQKCDAISKETVLKAYRGTMLDMSDAGKRDKHGREENVSVAQKTSEEHAQISTALSDNKFIKYNSRTPLETIQEEALCSPHSQYSVLNDMECIYQERPFDMNKNYKSDMLKSFHEHYILEPNSYHVPSPAVPKQNLCGTNKDGIHSRRIRTIWKKMDAVFDGILNLYGKIPEPDGSHDLVRRCKRAVEFSSRFSRNYLYQLRQQVGILCGMCK
jgi:hypothetical protein